MKMILEARIADKKQSINWVRKEGDSKNTAIPCPGFVDVFVNSFDGPFTIKFIPENEAVHLIKGSEYLLTVRLQGKSVKESNGYTNYYFEIFQILEAKKK